MGGKIDIVRMGEPDWARLRDLRLEMLADTPLAYVETLAAARALTDEQWRERAARYTEPGTLCLVAVEAETDRSIGSMRCFTEAAVGKTWLIAVYVAAEHRGAGVADRLLDGVEEWARSRGVGRLWLFVHEANHRAQRFYQRRGYAFTGAGELYGGDRNMRELEMVRDLG